MSGRYLLDTNAIIYALNRQLKLPQGHYAVSVITKLELLSWPSLTREDEFALRGVLASISTIQLDNAVQEMSIKVRRSTSLRLPDSIISATAISGDFILITDDEKLGDRHVGRSLTLDQLVTDSTTM